MLAESVLYVPSRSAALMAATLSVSISVALDPCNVQDDDNFTAELPAVTAFDCCAVTVA
ncbi:hypothetical protein AWB79_02629 [Caballeronia hypogeia]|uniref:Uncharacterized protein n=1 Tax=Caballeronia hypogeia TaxID=1777140 RepID=A0A158APH5_9BURK|nr:hypothetical protein AWB79_02629 [Caballeronia hypogeia]